ncbi:DUF4064 domain-containing protein [Clostridium kluyveri]|uniref:DUF4064 domain-containing protein n=2 Tax=Clostridium kluyveri TaxID=1534 RepID=A5F9L1_CLOK5|nr:DUF4064 domain-containing protein [Clostridium kluyveri]ABQ23657.1 conserved hypothetical protein [Clostridium kluyveri DSM 555]BAH08574.1 hypothetical protein CKR_P55 [Clostridium kluyveri NBRC 12016]
MKKTAFILGTIAGIVGIISCGILLYVGLNTTVDHDNVYSVIIISFIGLILQIVGLVYALMVESKTEIAGKVMIVAGISDLIVSFFSILGDSPVTFIICFVVFVLFLISGIFAIKASKETITE